VEYGFNGDTKATNGVNFQWGDSDFRTQQQGQLLAKIRQERSIAAQCYANGRGDVMLTRPGEVLRLNGHSAIEAPHGWLVVNAHHKASREESYVNDFEVIPADRVWRPEVLPVPKITGTLPAKVSAAAAEESFYATIDEIGRYRVKLPFDLDTWNPGGDSRPVRLAKAYAGSHYGIHFPLHSSVEVALGFTNGDPNRPYIAHVFHDSNHEDHVNNQWHTRNVIRTWGKNKLRMEDFKGKEHVKLATEYNKTQLNLGHLVDAKREQRGEGFELRTDGWGAVRGGKGLFLSAHEQNLARGTQLDMEAVNKQIDNALSTMKNLTRMAKEAKAVVAECEAQHSMFEEELKQLKQAVFLASSPKSMALSSGKHLQLAANGHLFANSGGNMDVGTGANFTVASGKAISLFANTGEMKLFANKGKVAIQAQKSTLQLAAYKDLDVSSSNGEIRISAKKSIVLACGGGYLKIHPSGEVEIGSPLKIKMKSPLYGEDPASLPTEFPPLPKHFSSRIDVYDLFWQSGFGQVGYEGVMEDGFEVKGVLDEFGRTGRLDAHEKEAVDVVFDSVVDWYETFVDDEDENTENGEKNNSTTLQQEGEM
jgi:type VI secretion system secreted protein VgrG